MKTKTWWGFVKFNGQPAMKSTWPILKPDGLYLSAALTASRGELNIRLRDLYLPYDLPVDRGKVLEISEVRGKTLPFGAWILIRHQVPVYPPGLMFYCFRGPRILECLSGMGYPVSTLSLEA